MNAPTLRRATEADHDAIAELWHASASLPGVGPLVMPSVADMRADVDAASAAGWVVTLAICDGTVVGFAALKPDVAVLDQLFVAPHAVGGGVGRSLLAHAMAAMPAGFTLFTRPSNERAIRFYRKAGLVAFRHGVHPQTGEPINYFIWRP
jgi:ribosomal protein S18 acetylase RimI-like enzyme